MKSYSELKDNPRLKVQVTVPDVSLSGSVALKGVMCSFVATWADEHVSIAPYNGTMPTWDMMCALKTIFYEDEEEAYQIHPKKSEYVDIKKNCLHIWGKKGIEQC